MPILLTLAVVTAPVQAPSPGAIKSFGDWAVACDNTRRCEAASLPLTADGQGDDAAQNGVAIAREAGPAGGVVIEVDVRGNGVGTLMVDGKRVASGRFGAESFTVDGAEAANAARAMAGGKMLSVFAGKQRGIASLAGLSATLRFMDAAQGRADGVTALVARGARPTNTVPDAQAPPTITYVRPAGRPAPIPPRLAAMLLKQAGCDDETSGQTIQTSALGGGKTLALIPCGAGAYNFSSVPMILSVGSAVIAKLDSPGGFTTAEGGIPTLVNANFDVATARLTSYAKGRGVGDCGSAEEYVWDGAMFRLVEARRMDECRGSANWLTTWRARAVAR